MATHQALIIINMTNLGSLITLSPKFPCLHPHYLKTNLWYHTFYTEPLQCVPLKIWALLFLYKPNIISIVLKNNNPLISSNSQSMFKFLWIPSKCHLFKSVSIYGLQTALSWCLLSFSLFLYYFYLFILLTLICWSN